MKKPYKHYEEITFLVKYFADGTIYYENPNTGELLFTRKTPTGKSPIVDLTQDMLNMSARMKQDMLRLGLTANTEDTQDEE